MVQSILAFARTYLVPNLEIGGPGGWPFYRYHLESLPTRLGSTGAMIRVSTVVHHLIRPLSVSLYPPPCRGAPSSHAPAGGRCNQSEAGPRLLDSREVARPLLHVLPGEGWEPLLEKVRYAPRLLCFFPKRFWPIVLDGPPGRGKTAPNPELLDVLRQVCPAALRVRPQVCLLGWGGTKPSGCTVGQNVLEKTMSRGVARCRRGGRRRGPPLES